MLIGVWRDGTSNYLSSGIDSFASAKAAVRNNNAAIKVDESKIQVERAPGCAGCKKVETWDELNAMAGGVKIPQPVFQAITDVLKYAASPPSSCAPRHRVAQADASPSPVCVSHVCTHCPHVLRMRT